MLSTGKIDEIPQAAMRPVIEYKDKLLSIDTVEQHSILLHIPYLPLNQFIDSVCKDRRTVEKILCSALPTLDNYTNMYINKLLPCLQEICFTQNQVIFKPEEK